MSQSPQRVLDEQTLLPHDFIKFIRDQFTESAKNEWRKGTKLLFKCQSNPEAATQSNQTQVFVYSHTDPLQKNVEVEVVIPACKNTDELRAFILLTNQPMLGSGFEGIVIKAHELFHNRIVACKIRQDADSDNPFVLRECQMLRKFEDRLQGRHKEQIGERTYYYIFMTYYPGYSLLEHLYEYPEHEHGTLNDLLPISKRVFPFLHQADLCLQVLDILIRIQDKGIIYGDFKTNNIRIFEKNNRYYLVGIDFGSAFLMDDAFSIQTLDFAKGYVAPELNHFKLVKQNSPFELPAFYSLGDLYSCGVILAEILSTTNFQQIIAAVEPGTHFKDVIVEGVANAKEIDALEPEAQLKHLLCDLTRRLLLPSALDPTLDTSQLKETRPTLIHLKAAYKRIFQLHNEITGRRTPTPGLKDLFLSFTSRRSSTPAEIESTSSTSTALPRSFTAPTRTVSASVLPTVKFSLNQSAPAITQSGSNTAVMSPQSIIIHKLLSALPANVSTESDKSVLYLSQVILSNTLNCHAIFETNLKDLYRLLENRPAFEQAFAVLKENAPQLTPRSSRFRR